MGSSLVALFHLQLHQSHRYSDCKGAALMSARAGRDRYTRAFSEGLRSCAAEAQGYGLCIKATLPEVERGVCEKEFQLLKSCVGRALKASLAKTR